jgi:hypothetical protein
VKFARTVSALSVLAGVLAGAAVTAAPAQAASFTKSVQLEDDNTNLDAYDGSAVWTRDPSVYFYQVWDFTQVGTTPEGTGVYTISSTTFPGVCIQDAGVGAPVVQAPCSPNNLAQRWVVNQAQEHTTIASEKNQDEVLQGNGPDTTVTLSMYTATPNQWWTLYDK